MLYNGIEVTDPNAIWWIEENQRIKALPIISKHYFVTLGSKTRNGGVVHTATSGRTIDGISVALVGDEVRYPNGEIATIMSGAGAASIYDGKCLAVEGSHASNGDVIETSNQKGHGLVVRAGMPPVLGFFQERYMPPSLEASLA
ncbi:PAAR domain-containing protein [Herbaspirillum lusitanum]|uniref:PAAR domain-containing protein n=1 Tax=Herbaspirillum lusitanum TaxID=213312 RepID=UPI0003729552|nr:PAAR domain-containing protein [Herbaspirillum lusitanum]